MKLMIKRPLISILVLMGVVLAPALSPGAGAGEHGMIKVGPGASDFVVQGERFRITTPESLSLVFEGVSPERVWGTIVLDDEACPGVVRLVWLRQEQPSLLLHEGPILERELPFDSLGATGHNEK
jgi:hypothetical protein